MFSCKDYSKFYVLSEDEHPSEKVLSIIKGMVVMLMFLQNDKLYMTRFIVGNNFEHLAELNNLLLPGYAYVQHPLTLD